MIWIAGLFVAGTITQWVVVKPKHKLQDWIVQIGLLALSVVMAVILQSGLWPDLDPLKPLKAIFMPIGIWMYNHV